MADQESEPRKFPPLEEGFVPGDRVEAMMKPARALMDAAEAVSADNPEARPGSASYGAPQLSIAAQQLAAEAGLRGTGDPNAVLGLAMATTSIAMQGTIMPPEHLIAGAIQFILRSAANMSQTLGSGLDMDSVLDSTRSFLDHVEAHPEILTRGMDAGSFTGGDPDDEDPKTGPH